MFRRFLGDVLGYFLITNVVCVGVTLLRGAPVYFLRSFKEVRTVRTVRTVNQF